MPSLESLLHDIGEDDDPNFEAELDSPDPIKRNLCEARAEVEKRMGSIPLNCRYHSAPSKLSDDYEMTSTVLGEGLNGEVRLAYSKHRPKVKYAVKSFPLTDLQRAERHLLKSEILVTLCMDHPNVACLVDAYETRSNLSIVTECMLGGDLYDRFDGCQGTWTISQSCSALQQILLALNYIHSHGIAHRDIKHGNILFDREDSGHLVLIDFGFSRHTMDSPPASTRAASPSASPARRRRMGRMHTPCGTQAFMAPEMRGFQGYTTQCDLWSVGIIAYQLLTGHMPVMEPARFSFHLRHTARGLPEAVGHEISADSVANTVSTGTSHRSTTGSAAGPLELPFEENETWSQLPATAKDFVSGLLQWSPEHRFTANAALKHPFLAYASSPQQVTQDVVCSLRDFCRMPRMRRSCLLMIAWSLSAEEQALVRDQFMQINASHTGTISKQEFMDLLNGACVPVNSLSTAEGGWGSLRRNADSAFEELDVCHDREIHFSTFLAAMVPSFVGWQDDILQATFRRFEAGDAEHVHIDSIARVLGELPEPGHDVSFDTLFDEFGGTQDGMVSFATFASYVADQKVTATPRDVANVDEVPAGSKACCSLM